MAFQNVLVGTLDLPPGVAPGIAGWRFTADSAEIPTELQTYYTGLYGAPGLVAARIGYSNNANRYWYEAITWTGVIVIGHVDTNSVFEMYTHTADYVAGRSEFIIGSNNETRWEFNGSSTFAVDDGSQIAILPNGHLQVLGEAQFGPDTTFLNGSDIYYLTQQYDIEATAPGGLGTGAGGPVPGTFINVDTMHVNAKWSVDAIFDFACSVAGTTVGRGLLQVDGITQTKQVLWGFTAITDRATCGQNWSGVFATPGTHSFELWCNRSAAAGAQQVNNPHTGYKLSIWER